MAARPSRMGMSDASPRTRRSEVIDDPVGTLPAGCDGKGERYRCVHRVAGLTDQRDHDLGVIRASVAFNTALSEVIVMVAGVPFAARRAAGHRPDFPARTIYARLGRRK